LRTLSDQIADLISDGLRKAQEAGELPRVSGRPVVVERPRQAGFGDYASPVCLQLAKEASMPPRDIARRLIGHIPSADFMGSLEVAGPGYINVSLDDSWLVRQVSRILQDPRLWGTVDVGGGRRVQVEFVSANPTGPLTVGSARNAVIGDTLANVLAAAGYEVEREYYVNDAGSQVRKFGESIFAAYAQSLGLEEPFPEDGYHGSYVRALASELASEAGDSYMKMPRRQAIRRLGTEGVERMLVGIRADLQALRIEFDTWFHEKSLYESGLFDRVLNMLRERGDIVERDKAIWFASEELDADAVVVRSPEVIPEPDERPTYLASDMAYLWDKLVQRGFDEAIYIWGADHHGDVPRVKAAAAALGVDPERLVIILYQMVNLKRGGEDVRMSKRTGEFVTLRELMDDVGSDPIRFMLLTRTVDATVDFDLDLAVEQSDKNPVYYVQYAHARICSILRHARELGWDTEAPADVALLQDKSELALLRKMLEQSEVLSLAARQRAPHHLTFYALELAGVFHGFYRDCRVVDAEHVELTRARLALVKAARIALARVLELLGVASPERM
jgi:arginyl-tRNA synthetase